MCASASHTEKLNWGSGEKQSNAAAEEEAVVAGKSQTPEGLENWFGLRRKTGDRGELTGRLRDGE